MADLLLCLDSGCGIDLTNNSGRLGAAIRADSSRALKCDGTTRNLYVGTRNYAGQINPNGEQDCSNQLKIDGSGNLWVPPTIGACDITIPDTSFLDLPGPGSDDRDADLDIYTNNSGCTLMLYWKYDVQVNVQAAAGFTTGDVLHWSGLIAVENMGGGVGTYPTSIRRTVQAPFSSGGIGAGDSYREWFQISGFHILNAGQTMRHRRVVYGASKNAQVAAATSANNGIAFTNGGVMVSYGIQV